MTYIISVEEKEHLDQEWVACGVDNINEKKSS